LDISDGESVERYAGFADARFAAVQDAGHRVCLLRLKHNLVLRVIVPDPRAACRSERIDLAVFAA
jgi:hypothetical protein